MLSNILINYLSTLILSAFVKKVGLSSQVLEEREASLKMQFFLSLFAT